MQKQLITYFLVLAFTGVFASEPLLKPTLQPYAKIQFWNVYSQNFEVEGVDVSDRFASYFRRGRLGLKGHLMDRLNYNIMCSFDYLGKSENLSSKGKANANTISLWSAYFTFQPAEKSQWLMITGGSFLPHLSRESVTSPWATSSLDKGETSCYLRQFVTGKTNGICPGVNIGGLGDIGKSHLLYNVAMISRQDNSSFTKSKWSPLLIGHTVLTIGDKEWSSYKYTFSGNPMKTQRFLSIGAGGSTQGKTDAFQSSSSYGVDFLLLLNNFKLDGEYYWLHRENTTCYLATCFQLRGSYNFFLQNGCILEPAVMFCRFNGDDTYPDASFYDGEDSLLDTGVNLISIKQKTKFSIHYIYRTGEATSNHRVTSGGTYGDYLNFGIQLVI
ncbi:porin [Sunxiuqinia sp. A32]|uniref:porin n=1 Tax=Sunxiuqinia sp. A32 TaxID=3461496 RepID=UPI004045B2DA